MPTPSPAQFRMIAAIANVCGWRAGEWVSVHSVFAVMPPRVGFRTVGALCRLALAQYGTGKVTVDKGPPMEAWEGHVWMIRLTPAGWDQLRAQPGGAA